MKVCNNCGITEGQCKAHGRDMVKAPHSGDQDLCNVCREEIYGRQNPKIGIKSNADTLKQIQHLESELVQVDEHMRRKPAKKAASKKPAAKKTASKKTAKKKSSTSKKG